MKLKRAIELDFLAVDAPRPAAGTLLLAAGVLGAALLGWRFVQLQEESARLAERIDALGAGRAFERAEGRKAAASPELAGELVRARAVAHSLAVPWHELFADIEGAVTPHVALLGVQPDLANARVMVTGEAKTLRHGLAFTDRLGRGRVVRDAMLTNHEVRTQDPQRPVRFTVEARWRTSP